MKEKNRSKPIIGITMGDGAGIGPEIICKTFIRKTFKKFCEIIVIGNKSIFDLTIKHYGLNINTEVINNPEEVYLLKEDVIGIIESNNEIVKEIKFGKPSKIMGEIALKSIDFAVELARDNKIDAIVTAPINKEVVSLVKKDFMGHTEYIAEKFKISNINMMMVSNKIKVTLVTTHIPLKDVAKNITKEKLRNAIKNTDKILKDIGYTKSRIAVLGLNPHSSDGGLFGDEEEKIIIPVIEEFKNLNNIKVTGPYSADSFFYKYSEYPIYDAIIAHYHDQGLIPFKIFSFGIGINVTLGLPIIRTSVDHGTAYDIAGKNKASDRSLFEALKFAVLLAKSDKKL